MHHGPLCSSHGPLSSPLLSGWKTPYPINMHASFSPSSSVTLLKRLSYSPQQVKTSCISFLNMVPLSFVALNTVKILHQFGGLFDYILSFQLDRVHHMRAGTISLLSSIIPSTWYECSMVHRFFKNLMNG